MANTSSSKFNNNEGVKAVILIKKSTTEIIIKHNVFNELNKFFI